eukprot:CAMPEP_0113617284 /NCGR_PEP_ID=MMETSP0017_2-20120614/8695_1 /TAXON_ID=2856 /ORGANISM="Cylindrotheca closterium" /LENGTH=559 /DNA_ID=CAMNT_0000526663 /DNA_START=147 /DNA_END=1827 /DNA_ORIENTATION=- /assembly_acc=CAM_ASM_000147
MGGASSRLDQTQWWNADGELMNIESEEKLPTILPGAEPTSTLEIFDIVKCKSLTATRDFEVKDSNKNVIYATKAVPGTMAWFDVIKPGPSVTPELAEGDEDAETSEVKEGDGEDNEETPATTVAGNETSKEELLLRVQVDWNRRSWTIYTLTPVFPGQLPATLPIRKGLDEGCELYKSCCITLSWSKSFAVVVRYGPPKVQDFLEDDEEDEQKQNGATEAGDHVEASGESEHSLEEDDLFAKAESIAAKERKKHNVDEDIVKHNQSQTLQQSNTSLTSEDEPTGVIDTLAKSLKTYIDPALEQPKVQLTPEEKQRYALEGVVNLDAPMLQCQTVLGKKKNYQSRVIDKEETVKLWVLDDAWNKERFLKQEGEDPTRGSTKSPLGKAVAYELSQLEKPHDVEELKKWFSTQYVDEDQRYMAKDDIKKDEGKSSFDGKRASILEVGKSWFSFRTPHKSDGDESVATQDEPGENTDPGDSAETETATEEANKKTTAEEAANAKVYGSNHGVLELDDSPDRKEPLVSYWRWKNTYTTHKMQMHLAKNSDLALHTVLSIVLNIW